MIPTVTSQSVLCSDSLIFQRSFYSRDLHKKEETMVFEAHGMSFPCTELLLFNYAKVNTVFHSMAPLISITYINVSFTLLHILQSQIL